MANTTNVYGKYNTGLALSLTHRIAELYGFIVAHKSSVRDVGNNGGSIFVIRCDLNFLSTVLSTIPLMNPPAVTLLISGTVKHLRMNLQIHI